MLELYLCTRLNGALPFSAIYYNTCIVKMPDSMAKDVFLTHKIFSQQPPDWHCHTIGIGLVSDCFFLQWT